MSWEMSSQPLPSAPACRGDRRIQARNAPSFTFFNLRAVSQGPEQADPSVLKHLSHLFKCEIRLICEDEVADLKSIMNIMGLVVKKGMIFTVTAEGVDEDCVLDKIENILKDTRVI